MDLDYERDRTKLVMQLLKKYNAEITEAISVSASPDSQWVKTLEQKRKMITDTLIEFQEDLIVVEAMKKEQASNVD